MSDIEDAIRGAAYQGERLLFEQLLPLGDSWREHVSHAIVATVDIRAWQWRTHLARTVARLQKSKRRTDRRYERRHGRPHPNAGPLSPERVAEMVEQETRKP